VKFVACYRLQPPSAEEERWPWSVRVRVLGPFEVTVDDEPLNGALKTQRKPLELLKYTIAMGGRDVAGAAAMQALWPDAEGDAAKRSFDVTLHRLRRALRRDDAVVLEGGKLALNPGVVWADALAFARLAAQAAEALRTGSPLAAETEACISVCCNRIDRRPLHHPFGRSGCKRHVCRVRVA
jgi:LuxR family transcriptional regulator, maltose regulon positive regulatory protein